MTQTEQIRWKKYWIMTIGLILVIAAASFLVSRRINRIEEEKCFSQLYDETGKLSDDIERHIADSTKQLEMLAAVAGRNEDLGAEQLWNIMDFCRAFGIMSKLELLLPDDTVLTNGGQREETDGSLSFETEAALGAHITGRIDEAGDSGCIVKNCVPVMRDGETVAMLYGELDLKRLIEKINAQPYDGKAAIYIMEGATGDFLVDTWHEKPGNIWELGERKMAPGYNHDQLKQGLISGESGYVVFVSETIGEYLYFYYEPMEINDWRIALSVSESVVFEGADAIRFILNVFLVLEALGFLLYLIWVFRQFRGEMRAKQKQMNMLNYIYNIQKLLFNAHELRRNVVRALEDIGQITSSEYVGFWMVEGTDERTAFTWSDGTETDVSNHDEMADQLIEYFEQRGMEFTASNGKELRAKLPQCELGRLKRLAAIPIEGAGGSICGVLASGNMKDVQRTLAFLKNVGFSFSMLLQNMRSYDAIRQKGEKDILTGLNNRNRYEMDVKEQKNAYEHSLACIYIDVNGLHELNNEKGHAAGDAMLKSVAGQIQSLFGRQHSYRIGGDEFLVFVSDVDELTVTYQVRRMTEDLRKENIYISAGIQWAEEVPSVDAMIKEAERKMYEAKRRYYSQGIHARKERHIT